MVLFYNMLDIATYNAYVLYATKYPEFVVKHKSRSRRQFIKVLIEEVIGFDENDQATSIPEPRQKSNRKGRCASCSRNIDRKMRISCYECDKPVCNDHSSVICMNCKRI